MRLRHESIERGKREVVKTEAEKIVKKWMMAKRNYADSLGLPVRFTRLAYLLV
jgi:hypothetical protein